MKIGPLQGNQLSRVEYQKSSPCPEEEKDAEKKDTVEISQEARKKLAELADQTLKQMTGKLPDKRVESDKIEQKGIEGKDNQGNKKLTPERLAEIRKRMASGFYDCPEIKNEIIDRLADDLDLG